MGKTCSIFCIWCEMHLSFVDRNWDANRLTPFAAVAFVLPSFTLIGVASP